MAKRKKGSYGASREARKHLTADQIRFNHTATRKKGTPGNKDWKKYVFGRQTNVRKGRA